MQILSNPGKKEMDSMIKMQGKEIIEKLKKSGLIGRSGSNFSTGLKWELTSNSPGKRVLICNADEGEPGTFKDRFIIENNPELLLNGIAIGQKVLDAEAFIYLRGEYEYLKDGLYDKIRDMGLDIKIVMGAGSYVCGEETALIESIEGSRGYPRAKPPYPTVSGLWSRPTCVNNVETLANVPLILSGKWNPKLRLFSLSGSVKKPGIYELETGLKLKDVAEICGAKNPYAVCMGYSGGIVSYEKFKNLVVDDKSFQENSFFLGPCSMIFLGSDIDIVEAMKNICDFFVHESCGRCLPCREGGFRILQIIDSIASGKATADDISELKDLCEYMDMCFCPLGRSYGFVIKKALENFSKDIDRHLKK